MALADLHVHSMYSKHPAQWFLQRIGTRESYTEIQDVYRIAKERGMTYVTLSDHNTIEGALKLVELYPQDTFVSVEATAYFPEDGCKIHVLVYDLTEQQFREIDRIRNDIYNLRDYLREQHLAYSVAHATYNINSRLQFETLEKLILLFDVFEEINGARNPKYNFIWGQALSHLTPEDIDRLYDTYRIEPFSDEPWEKGLTGGSDDHAGLFIGQTFTESECSSRQEFLQCLRTKKTIGGGKSSNFKSLAFAVYKIACDFSQSGGTKNTTGSFAFINSLLFENKQPGFRKRLALKTMKNRHGDEKVRIFTKFLDDLIADFRTHTSLSIDEKIDRLYKKIASMSDEFFAIIFASLERDFQQGDMSGLIKNVSAILPAMFLSAPFFSTLKHLSDDRDLNTRIQTELLDKYTRFEKHVLWFSDTFDEAHEIGNTFKQAMHSAHHQERSLRFVISNPTIERETVPNLINLPAIYSYTPDFYPSYTMHVASFLQSLEIIYQHNPDEVIVSTPGPIGFLGIMTAKLLGIPCSGIFQTDFVEQIKNVFPDDYFADPIDGYLRWFYSYMDTIYVPDRTYISTLEERGYDGAVLKVFPDTLPSSSDRNWEEILYLLLGTKPKASPPKTIPPYQPAEEYRDNGFVRTGKQVVSQPG